MKITVVGIGYVGLSNAILLSKYNDVYALDINKKKIDILKSGISPIDDKDISSYLKDKKLNFKATTNKEIALKSSDYVLISTPTNFNEIENRFDTSSVIDVIKDIINYSPNSYIIIKSTVPIGFTNKIKKEMKISNIAFCPEFLREGKALYDNLYPSRIVIGDSSKKAKTFGKLLTQAALKKNIDVIYTSSSEAESIKLFSNTYLAMRVSFFNEIDNFSEMNSLSSRNIIKGVSSDPRIGNYYNNPSFGYGGYCLPKDTKQLLSNFKDVPNSLIEATIESNIKRKKFIFNSILGSKKKTIGIYRLVMKTNSDNFREAAVIDLIKMLKKKKINVIIYEPNYRDQKFEGFEIQNDLLKFKEISELIVANRYDNLLEDVIHKVYTRDLYSRDWF